jgi:hypothetical protein
VLQDLGAKTTGKRPIWERQGSERGIEESMPRVLEVLQPFGGAGQIDIHDLAYLGEGFEERAVQALPATGVEAPSRKGLVLGQPYKGWLLGNEAAFVGPARAKQGKHKGPPQ